MSNFDFLKNFNNELYELGMKLEDDVMDAPRAVTADATLFLETLVKDIYKLSKKKLDNENMSFYKKVDNLYRLGVISYIYKNKLQDAYNLRSKIHINYQNEKEEKNLALDIHQRLYYISKKYFKDYCDDERYVTIPDYKKPEYKTVVFENCIICGRDNKDVISNMCDKCNKKVENANLLLSIQNQLDDKSFTRHDLIKLGVDESESISLLMELSKENIVFKKGNSYAFNCNQLKKYIDKVNTYIDIGLLITRFYKDEISADEIKNTSEYKKGRENLKQYKEFYKLVTAKIERNFEQTLCKTEKINKSMKESSMDKNNLRIWFKKRRKEFLKGSLNDAFIIYNEILLNEYFKLKRKGFEDRNIFNYLNISPEIHNFWQKEFIGSDFIKQNMDITKDLILKELRKNKTLAETLNVVGITKKEFDEILILSKSGHDDFYNNFEKVYIKKRQKSLIKHLKKNNLNSAIHLSKISKKEFLRWYSDSEIELSNFYVNTSKILMAKFLELRKNGLNKKEIFKEINITQDIFQSWLRHDEIKEFHEFKNINDKLTSNLVKRGLIINYLKEDKNKSEAIYLSGLTDKEFQELYEDSKKEKTDFHKRFDMEYANNRKRLFSKLILKNDFFNTIQKCEISQMEFNKWYLQDQDKFLSNDDPSDFYLKTTKTLMKMYLEARKNGKNKPDAARSVGLSNTIINKWTKHTEFILFYEFKKAVNQLMIDLIVKGFNDGKTKSEVSEIYDIPVGVINEFINLGKSGFNKYAEIYNLHETLVIPKQLDNFLSNFKNKSFNKSLKLSKLSKHDIEYYYQEGKSGHNIFKEFHKRYLELKIKLYIKDIIVRKSSKIALKNSNLTKEELQENKDEIDDKILTERLKIICEEVMKHKTNGVKLAKRAGVTVEDIYNWYFEGMDEKSKFNDFHVIFALCFILPRVKAYQTSVDLGISKNWVDKRLKKDLGDADYKIWQKHDILNMEHEKFIDFKKMNISEDKFNNIMDSFKNIKNIKAFYKDDNSDDFECFELFFSLK